ncbi:hypothetical protein B0H13DRAFT_2303243 [Mycena leptocephala]|nr:hypothetical protein B0H13DRAFT_2303243 [Mycena leptocephala]
MPKNLVFFGLHFVIVYANSLLISLNTWKELREVRWSNKSDWDPAVPVLIADDFTVPYTRSCQYGAVTSLIMTASSSGHYFCAQRYSRRSFIRQHLHIALHSRHVNPHMLSPTLEINVERRVECRSDDINSIIQSNYTHSQRPTTHYLYPRCVPLPTCFLLFWEH